MRAKLWFLSRSFSLMAVAAVLLAAAGSANAQGVNSSRGGVVGPSGVILSPGMPAQNNGTTAPPPPRIVPQRSTSGAIATGSRASTVLPGDNPSAPGFPGPVGK